MKTTFVCNEIAVVDQVLKGILIYSAEECWWQMFAVFRFTCGATFSGMNVVLNVTATAYCYRNFRRLSVSLPFSSTKEILEKLKFSCLLFQRC